LVIGIALKKENIDHGQLVDVAVALKLLPDAGPNRRDRMRDGVHGLYLGRLEHTESASSLVRDFESYHTARIQFRYAASTRCFASAQLAAVAVRQSSAREQDAMGSGDCLVSHCFVVTAN
jgi:hypothetical protein